MISHLGFGFYFLMSLSSAAEEQESVEQKTDVVVYGEDDNEIAVGWFGQSGETFFSATRPIYLNRKNFWIRRRTGYEERERSGEDHKDEIRGLFESESLQKFKSGSQGCTVERMFGKKVISGFTFLVPKLN